LIFFKSPNTSKDIGRQGEAMAKKFLKKKGFRIIDENYRTRWGELDLIVQDGKVLVFVEVKTRSQKTFGSPLSAVTAEKQQRIIRMAKTYLAERNMSEVATRFDVIGIKTQNGHPPEIDWIPNAFGGF